MWHVLSTTRMCPYLVRHPSCIDTRYTQPWYGVIQIQGQIQDKQILVDVSVLVPITTTGQLTRISQCLKISIHTLVSSTLTVTYESAMSYVIYQQNVSLSSCASFLHGYKIHTAMVKSPTLSRFKVKFKTDSCRLKIEQMSVHLYHSRLTA